MSSLSAGKIQVDSLNVAGLGAGSIKARNLNFNNLDVSGNLTVQGAQVATQAFVSSAVSSVIGSAGAALDTLGEIQAALGNDANLASTLTNSIATKAPLASPALTGVPTAPTAAAGTNTTQLATTAFVTAADALKANLASPALTGVPTAPTAAAGTNTTQVATTGFVQGELSMLKTVDLSEQAYWESVLDEIGLVPSGTTVPSSSDIFNLPARFTDPNNVNLYPDSTGIYEIKQDITVNIKENGEVVDYGTRANGPTAYILSYDSSNVNIPTWTPLSDSSNAKIQYLKCYEDAPNSLGISNRFSKYNTQMQAFTPTNITNILTPVFGRFIDRGYNIPTPDYSNSFRHMFAGNENNGVYAIEFEYNVGNTTTVPNTVYVSCSPFNITGSSSLQSTMFNGGFYLTNNANSQDSNIYMKPAPVPVTTDPLVFKNVYGTTGACALYDSIKHQIHIYFSGSFATTSSGATSAEFNSNTDGIGISWTETCELNYFVGSFAIVKKRADITDTIRPFAAATSFDTESFLVQISPNFSVTFTATPEKLDKYSTEIIIEKLTSDGNYQGLIFPKIGNGTSNFDVMTYYYPAPNAYSTYTTVPVYGNNPNTKAIEKFSTSSLFVLYNNSDLSSFILSSNYQNLYTDTPEQLFSNVDSSNIYLNAQNAADLVAVHELSHSLRDFGSGLISRGYGVYLNTEGHAVSMEMQRAKELNLISSFRNPVYACYIRNLFRGAWNVERVHHRYIGDLHTGYSTQSGRIRSSQLSAYGEGMFYNYIVERYDANHQVERYFNDLMNNDLTETLELANYPVNLSLIGTSTKLAQNKFDQALRSLTSQYGPEVSLSDAFVDFCVSVSLLRNNSTIPEKYRSKFPYWVFNKDASYWPDFSELTYGANDIALWSDTLEGIPCGSWPEVSGLGYSGSFPGDTVHPIWPKDSSNTLFSNGLDRNFIGSWANPGTRDVFTYAPESYKTTPLLHQVEDLTCVSYVIPITNGGSTVYGTSDYIDSVSVNVEKGDWVFKVVQYIPDSSGVGEFIQNFSVSIDNGATYTTVDHYDINISDSSYNLSTDSWSVGTAQSIKIKFDTFNTNCHGTDWRGVNVWYFPRLVCVHRKNHTYNRFRSVYPLKCIYSGMMTLQATLA